jgi:hypothetical protein
MRRTMEIVVRLERSTFHEDYTIFDPRSSMTRQFDSSNNSTLLFAPLRPKHVSNAYIQ